MGKCNAVKARIQYEAVINLTDKSNGQTYENQADAQQKGQT